MCCEAANCLLSETEAFGLFGQELVGGDRGVVGPQYRYECQQAGLEQRHFHHFHLHSHFHFRFQLSILVSEAHGIFPEMSWIDWVAPQPQAAAANTHLRKQSTGR